MDSRIRGNNESVARLMDFHLHGNDNIFGHPTPTAIPINQFRHPRVLCRHPVLSAVIPAKAGIQPFTDTDGVKCLLIPSFFKTQIIPNVRVYNRCCFR